MTLPPTNPYAASSLPARAPVVSLVHGPLASPWKRFVNALIDFTVTITMSFVLQLTLVTAIEMLLGVSLGTSLPGDLAPRITAPVPIIVIWLYYVISESVWQRTLGKLATGTLVVTFDGAKPSWWRIMGRSVVRLIPFEVLSFLGGDHPVGWHDRWSGTKVIDTPK